MSFTSNATGGGFGYNSGANYLTTSARREFYNKGIEDFAEAAIARYGNEEQGIMEMLKKMGATRQVSSFQYGHSEVDRLRKNIDVESVSGTASQTATLTLATTDVYTAPTPSTHTFYKVAGSDARLPVQKYDIIDINGVEVVVTAVNVGNREVSVRTVDGTNITIAKGVYPVTTNSYPEGTGHEEGTDRDLLDYQNNISIIKDQYAVTGTQGGTIGFINFRGTKFWYVNGIEDTRRRLDMKVENAILTSVKVGSTDAFFAKTSKTEGLIPFMDNYGVTQNYSSFDLATFKSGMAKLVKERSVSDFALIMNHSNLLSLQDMIRDLGGVQNGGINFGSSGLKALTDLNFGGFQYGGFNFAFNTIQAFDDPTGLGASQFYQDLVLGLPVGSTTVFDFGRQATQTRTYMSLVTQSVEGEVDGYWEGFEGGALGARTNLIDEKKIGMRYRVGFEGHCPNNFLLFKKI